MIDIYIYIYTYGITIYIYVAYLVIYIYSVYSTYSICMCVYIYIYMYILCVYVYIYIYIHTWHSQVSDLRAGTDFVRYEVVQAPKPDETKTTNKSTYSSSLFGLFNIKHTINNETIKRS